MDGKTTFLPLLLGVLCLGSAADVSAQQASLIGTVLEDSTERPIVAAEIAIVALKRIVRSDSAGNFTLRAIPAGVYQVTVRAVGREPVQETITFGPNSHIERDYLLARSTTTLSKVQVKADATVDDMRLAEFNERRTLGFGRFLTQDVFEKADGRRLSDVLSSRIPGLRSASRGGAMASTRGVLSFRDQRPCFVQVIVDRMIRYNGTQSPFDVNTIEPATIAGIEYFTTSQTPAQFNNTGTPCGTLVIWTRMR